MSQRRSRTVVNTKCIIILLYYRRRCFAVEKETLLYYTQILHIRGVHNNEKSTTKRILFKYVHTRCAPRLFCKLLCLTCFVLDYLTEIK